MALLLAVLPASAQAWAVLLCSREFLSRSVGFTSMISGLYLLSVGPKQGKTVVGAALVAALRLRGLRLAVMKPIETGCELVTPEQPVRIGGWPGTASAEELASLSRLAQLAGPPPAATFAALPPEALAPRDAPILLAAAKLQRDLSLVNPYRFALELEPAVAGRLAQRDVDLTRIQHCLLQLATNTDYIIVEGLEGPLTPLTSDALQGDLICSLALPVLLVAPSAASITNSCLLALEALSNRGISVAGIVLNRLQKALHPEEASSPYQIEQFAGPLVRGVLPYFSASQLTDWDFLGQRFEVHVDLDGILASSR